MWKRDDVRPANPHEETSPARPTVTGGGGDNDLGKIGKSVFIKGDLSGSEDLTIDGHVEGTVQLKENILTIGPHGRVAAQVSGKVVIIYGQVTGNVTASEKIEIREKAVVEGDLLAPRVSIAEGALFRGSVDMQRGQKAGKATPAVAPGPGAAAKPATDAPVAAPQPAPVAAQAVERSGARA